MDQPQKRLSSELIRLFMNMPWEGNVREMENLFMRGILFSTSDTIKPQDIGVTGHERSQLLTTNGFSGMPYRKAKEQTLDLFNHTFIGELLTLNQGNVTQAAKQCGLERQALQQIMKRYGVKADRYRQKSEDRGPEAR